MLFVIRGIDVLDAGVLRVISDQCLLPKNSLTLEVVYDFGQNHSFVPHGDLVNFNLVGT